MFESPLQQSVGDSMFKTLALLTFISIQAQATIKIDSITGATSGRRITATEVAVFASKTGSRGQICSVQNEFTSCDNCIGAGIDEACSARYVHDDSSFILVFTTTERGQVRLTDSADAAIPFKHLGGSATQRIAIKWSDVFMSLFSGGTLKLGIGTSAVNIRVAWANVPLLSQANCVTSDELRGVCDFRIESREIMVDIATSPSVPFDMAGFRVFALPVRDASECTPTSEACTNMDTMKALQWDVRIAADKSFNSNLQLDFSQGQKYCVRINNFDVAYNRSMATTSCKFVD